MQQISGFTTKVPMAHGPLLTAAKVRIPNKKGNNKKKEFKGHRQIVAFLVNLYQLVIVVLYQTCLGTSRLLWVFISAPVGVRDLVNVVRKRCIMLRDYEGSFSPPPMEATHPTLSNAFSNPFQPFGYVALPLEIDIYIWDCIDLSFFTCLTTIYRGFSI